MLLHPRDFRCFVVAESEMLATKRSGKQIINGRAMQAARVEGDQVAVGL